MKARVKSTEEIVELADYSSIDWWEQRRYEIAKDILSNSHIAQQLGHYSYIKQNEVKNAVTMADLLIAELKKTKE